MIIKILNFLKFEAIDSVHYEFVAKYLEKNENLKEFLFRFQKESKWNEKIIQNIIEINSIEILSLISLNLIPDFLFLNVLIEKMKNLKYLDLNFKKLDVNSLLDSLERNFDSKIVEMKSHLEFENNQFTRMNKILRRNKI